MSQELPLNNHIVNVAKRAYTILGFIYPIGRAIHEIEILKILLNGLVRSSLKFAWVV